MFKVLWHEINRYGEGTVSLEKSYDDSLKAFEFFHYLSTCSDVSNLILKYCSEEL